MSEKVGRFLALMIAVGAFVAVMIVSPSVEASAQAACNADGILEAAALPSPIKPQECDLQGRIINDSGLTAVVPPPGKGIYAEKLTELGAAQFAIETDLNGVVSLSFVGDELDPDGLVPSASSDSHSGGGTSPPPCEDTARWPYMKQSETHLWRYNPTFQPAGFTDTAAENAMQSGFNNITRANNDCGMPDRVGATHSYLGRTSRRAQVTATGCPSWFETDDTNVVDWGTLNDPTLATTCTWFIAIGTLLVNDPESREILESDILFRNNGVSWTTSPGSGCSNAWDIEGVATHEAGHSFGLYHPGEESEVGHLTMSPAINGTCQTSERTLGRGDVLGLEEVYGPVI